jgi:hypothetical protein
MVSAGSRMKACIDDGHPGAGLHPQAASAARDLQVATPGVHADIRLAVLDRDVATAADADVEDQVYRQLHHHLDTEDGVRRHARWPLRSLQHEAVWLSLADLAGHLDRHPLELPQLLLTTRTAADPPTPSDDALAGRARRSGPTAIQRPRRQQLQAAVLELEQDLGHGFGNHHLPFDASNGPVRAAREQDRRKRPAEDLRWL